MITSLNLFKSKSSVMKNRFFTNLVASLYIILFVYTGVMKIIEHAGFLGALNKNSLLIHFALPLSFIIPILELVLAIMLIAPNYRIRGLWGGMILMSAFSIYIYIMLEFRSERPCTCGGIISKMNWHQHLYFNVTFVLLALLALVLQKRWRNISDQNTSLAS